jgi:hypothetical protein
MKAGIRAPAVLTLIGTALAGTMWQMWTGVPGTNAGLLDASILLSPPLTTVVPIAMAVFILLKIFQTVTYNLRQMYGINGLKKKWRTLFDARAASGFTRLILWKGKNPQIRELYPLLKTFDDQVSNAFEQRPNIFELNWDEEPIDALIAWTARHDEKIPHEFMGSYHGLTLREHLSRLPDINGDVRRLLARIDKIYTQPETMDWGQSAFRDGETGVSTAQGAPGQTLVDHLRL